MVQLGKHVSFPMFGNLLIETIDPSVKFLLVKQSWQSHISAEEEFCQWETFNATCPEGEVIVMRTARYGRMKLGKCLTTDYFVGCSADVLTHVDAR